jgi:hypothetical protein
MICYKRVADLYLRRVLAAGDGRTHPMADNAACTRVRCESMAVTELVRIGNTLCRQQQKQQRNSWEATQCGGGKFHIPVTNNKIEFRMQQNFQLEVRPEDSLTASSALASIGRYQRIHCDRKGIGVATS